MSGIKITVNDNVYHLDQDAEIVLVQINQNHYQVRKGRWHIGDIMFFDDSVVWGWWFQSRTSQFRHNHRLGPFPEAVLPRKLKVQRVVSRGRQTNGRSF